MAHSLNLPEANLHPERASLYQELHARPFPIIEQTGHITHLALLLNEAEREADGRGRNADCSAPPRTDPSVRC